MEPKDLGLLDWIWLMAIALFAMPVAGMIAALVALDMTHSPAALVATGAALPAAAVAFVARRRGLGGGLVLRLALIAAMFAMVLLDLGFSGAPGS